jgi:NADPH2:quinone reductase
MQAVRIHEYGGPEAMRLEELPPPEPGAGQARVKIAAAGVNFIDIYQRSGQYKGALPFGLGQEGAGVVEAAGPDVTDLVVGDRVAWTSLYDSYATHAVLPAARLVKLGDDVPLETAAATMLQGLTAQYLTHDTFRLKAGDTVLVHAAAGGVGLLLCQIGRLLGVRVIGTVSTEEKAALAREAGAAEIIRYTEQDFEAEVKRLTDGRGVDVVYDSVGKDTFDKSLNCLHPRGYLVLFGQSSGAVAPLDPQVLNAKGSLFLTRPSLGHYIPTREELQQRADVVLGWVADGSLKIRVSRTYPLAEAAEAHRALAGRQTTGKVLLIP